MTENAKAQWVKYSSLLASAKELVNHPTALASESSSVQLEESGPVLFYLCWLIFHLYSNSSGRFCHFIESSSLGMWL